MTPAWNLGHREREREREEKFVMLHAQPPAYTCQVYTLTIFSKVTSTHTAIMMLENYRTLRPVNSKTNPCNHMEGRKVHQSNIVVSKNFDSSADCTGM